MISIPRYTRSTCTSSRSAPFPGCGPARFCAFILAILILPSCLFAQFGLPWHCASDQIVVHAAYTLSYNEQFEQPDWAAYELTSKMLTGHVSRTDDFRPDPAVKTGSATPGDYRGSGYDRGHLVPAADMAFSRACMSETFYMSNMSPQAPAFNRGIWKRLEELVRGWAKENGELFIVTGPVLSDGNFPTTGQNRVAVPRRFFKVILDYKEPELKAIAFILPNRRSDSPLESYALTVDEAEAITGMDFFPELPDAVERQLESKIELERWFH